MYTPTVTIPNPESPMDVPIYDGDPVVAFRVLVPGTYVGTADYTDLADDVSDELAAVPGTLVVRSNGARWTDESGADYAGNGFESF